ncbi:MAG TPA: FlgD immunoglobulin-like domain containing protein [Chitinivibrionales bacterium]|jgi:hypothetical protein|nr:FlgD immunoglobulin-like domain containing protein [Chitinivibrionales bacterium]
MEVRRVGSACCLLFASSLMAQVHFDHDDCGSALLNRNVEGTAQQILTYQHSLSPSRKTVLRMIRYSYGQNDVGDSIAVSIFPFCDTGNVTNLITLNPAPNSKVLWGFLDNRGYYGLTWNTWSADEDTVFFELIGSSINVKKDSAELFKLALLKQIAGTNRSTIPVPAKKFLSKSIPGPSGLSTDIRFDIAKPNFVSVNIYDSSGDLLRVLCQERMAAGSHSVKWDGKDNKGQTLSSGEYFYQIISGNAISSKTTILLKQ